MFNLLLTHQREFQFSVKPEVFILKFTTRGHWKKSLALLTVLSSPSRFSSPFWFLWLHLWSSHVAANSSSYSSSAFSFPPFSHKDCPCLFPGSLLSHFSSFIPLFQFQKHLVVSVLIILSACFWSWYLFPELLVHLSFHLDITASQLLSYYTQHFKNEASECFLKIFLCIWKKLDTFKKSKTELGMKSNIPLTHFLLTFYQLF